jgi:hypothetical protein
MARKRMVGPGGGDFALDISTAGGRLGGGRITKRKRPTKTAKPESSMKTKKGKAVTTVKRKRLEKVVEKQMTEVRKHRSGLEIDREGLKRSGKLIDKADKARILALKMVQQVRRLKARGKVAQAKKLANKQIKVERRISQLNMDARKSISGTIKGSNKDLQDFNRQLSIGVNRDKVLEYRRRVYNSKK